MKFAYISTHKKTPKMSVSLQEHIVYEATDKKLSEAQQTYISLSALDEIFDKTISSSEANEIMEAIELLLESGK